MIIRPGDRVKFLNDTGGGIVKDIRDSKIATVLIDDGFEVPVLISELLHAGEAGEGTKEHRPGLDEEPESFEGSATATVSGIDESDDFGEDFSQEANTYERSSISADRSAADSNDRNILLGLLEGSKANSLEAWLINDSRFSVFYNVLKKEESLYLSLMTGHIEPDTKIWIRTFSREEVNEFIEIRIQALFFMKGLYYPVSPSQVDFILDPVRVYSADGLTFNEFFDEPALVVHLISDSHDRELQKIREQEAGRLSYRKKDAISPADSLKGKPGERKTDPLVEEVDLHIEELVEDPRSLSGREILDLQMARFTTVLEGALRGKIKRMVFIHGIGNGKLKFEIRKALDNKYPRLRYQDASFKEYGYGATLVILRK